MTIEQRILSNPIRFFYRYCKSKGLKRTLDDTIPDCLSKLKIDEEKNLNDLEGFLDIIEGSKNTSFIFFNSKSKISNIDKSLFKITNRPLEKINSIQCVSFSSTSSMFCVDYSVFTRYQAAGKDSTIPIFDLYKVTGSINSKYIRIEGNLSFMMPVIASFYNSINKPNYDKIILDDEKFDKLKVALMADKHISDLKLLKVENKVLTGNVVDSLGFKSKEKKDLQDFISGNKETQGSFIDKLSNLISTNTSDLIIDEQKYCFFFEIYPLVKIDVVLSANRKGVLTLNTVPRCVYERIGEIFVKI